MSSQHKKPILAFVMLAVIAAAVIGNQIRASAEGSSRIAPCHTAVHAPVGAGARRPKDLAVAGHPSTACTPRTGSSLIAG